VEVPSLKLHVLYCLQKQPTNQPNAKRRVAIYLFFGCREA